ncbi:MAG: polysaccharide biosynthesis tyrosine autokinase [Chloroflexi bacterium]|nr:polysaccharide biosynthesis tyrosine autokinase [Chloroflexota bacterium]
MELRQYVAVVLKFFWLILLTTIVAGAGAFYYTSTQPTLYQSTTTLQISQANDPTTSDPYAVNAQRTVQGTAAVFAAKLQSPLFLTKVRDRLGLGDMPIGKLLSVAQVGETRFVRITAKTEDPGLSQALADTVSQILIEEETGYQQARFQEGLDGLQAQIDALEAKITATQVDIATLGTPETSEFVRLERARLESELNRDQLRLMTLLSSAEDFRLAMARYTDYVSIYTPAIAQTEPVPSKTLQNTALGLATGLMVGVGVAFLIDYLDDTIHAPDDVKGMLGVSVLGGLPSLRSEDQDVGVVVDKEPFTPVAEAFRNLRTSIQFAAVDGPLRTLLISSPLAAEGKTFTAANLAAVLAQGGQRVILVDCDLRKPMQHHMFELPREPGVTSVLLHPEQRAEALRDTGIEHLRVMPAGARTHNPAELLASSAFHSLVSWLGEQADVVILDSAPLLAVADAAILANTCDGTVLVVEANETRLPVAAQALERLATVEARLLGVVINRLSRSRRGYYYYHYYYYQYYSGEGEKRRGLWSRLKHRLFRSRRSRRGAQPRSSDVVRRPQGETE